MSVDQYFIWLLQKFNIFLGSPLMLIEKRKSCGLLTSLITYLKKTSVLHS